MKKLIASFATIASYLFLALPAFAREQLEGNECVEVTEKGDKILTFHCVPIIFVNILFWLIVFAGIIALIFIIIGGIKFITSGGEAKQAEGARKTLTWAVIGLIVIILSFTIVRFIADTTGVGCITKFGFTNCGQEATTCTPRGGTCASSGECCTKADGTPLLCRPLTATSTCQ